MCKFFFILCANALLFWFVAAARVHHLNSTAAHYFRSKWRVCWWRQGAKDQTVGRLYVNKVSRIFIFAQQLLRCVMNAGEIIPRATCRWKVCSTAGRCAITASCRCCWVGPARWWNAHLQSTQFIWGTIKRMPHGSAALRVLSAAHAFDLW